MIASIMRSKKFWLCRPVSSNLQSGRSGKVANDVHHRDDPQLAHAQPEQNEPVSTPNVSQDVSSNLQSGRSGEVANDIHHGQG